MQYWFGVAAAVLGLGVDPAFAADVANCALGTDRKTVTVTASNPCSQAMATDALMQKMQRMSGELLERQKRK